MILFISEQLRAGQIRGLQQHLSKRLKALEQWKEQLAKPRSGPRSPESRTSASTSCSAASTSARCSASSITPTPGRRALEYWIDEDATTAPAHEVFGKRIVVTNRHDWSTEDILLAYRGQSHVEAVFRQCKDDEHLAVRPQYHWTDQKIHVHAFICLLALLLARTVEREVRHQECCPKSLSALLETLAKVRLSMVLVQVARSRGFLPSVGLTTLR